MYNFILNPHTETRVSKCPSCEQRMRQRKVPLFIHVDPMVPVILGYTCRYCPDCDLLVAHQDEIETLLANMLVEYDPSAIGNDYLVMGTVERKLWREGMKTPRSIEDLVKNLHDFKQVLTLEYQPGGWYPDKDTVGDEGRSAPGREGSTKKQRRKRRPKRPGKRSKRSR
jgi:hypothetical protein